MLQEAIPCPVCTGVDYRLIFKSKDFRFRTTDETFSVVECRQCGFMYLNPRPSREEISRYYPADFHRRDESLFYKFIDPAFMLAQHSTINLLRKYKKHGKVLDIGCGNGSFLLSMQECGYDIWGSEQNPEAKRFSDKRLDGRIFYKDITACSFTEKTFDVITLFQSLEHIYDLEGLFRQINRILKDDGIVYICVPNEDFFEARLFGPYYYNLEVPRHLYFFTKKSLQALLAKYGFKASIFLRESLFEFASTPASLHHTFWYFMSDRNISVSSAVKYASYIPLVALRLILRLMFIFQNQNIKVLCEKI